MGSIVCTSVTEFVSVTDGSVLQVSAALEKLDCRSTKMITRNGRSISSSSSVTTRSYSCSPVNDNQEEYVLRLTGFTSR
jgi:hypothetical protein